MNLKNIKKDWWLYNSLLLVFLGLYTIYEGIIADNLSGGAIVGGVEILIAIALLQRSKIVFWLVLVTTLFGFIQYISVVFAKPEDLLSFGFLVSLASFVFVLMLWRQIRFEDKKK